MGEDPSFCQQAGSCFLCLFGCAFLLSLLQEFGISKKHPDASVGEAVSGEGSAGPVALAMAGLAALAALTIVAVTIRRRRHASANAQGVEHVPLAESDEETEAETAKGSALSEEEREKLTASV
jgi:Zn-dependent alcohol dehydrogenase